MAAASLPAIRADEQRVEQQGHAHRDPRRGRVVGNRELAVVHRDRAAGRRGAHGIHCAHLCDAARDRGDPLIGAAMCLIWKKNAKQIIVLASLLLPLALDVSYKMNNFC